MSKASDAGKSFLAGVLARLAEADRAQAEAIFGKAEHEGALEVLGTGALAQPEINRKFDELKVKEDELDDLRAQNQDWWDNNQKAIQEYRVIKPEYDKLKGTPPKKEGDPPLAPALDMKAFQDELEHRDRAFAGAFALGVTLSSRHLQMFNEVLDMSALLSDPHLGQSVKGQPGRVYGLQDAYNTVHGERVTAKATEAENTRINKLVEDRMVEERKKLSAIQQPYPTYHADPSPLDALAQKDGPASHTVDTAVVEYERLQQARHQSGA